MFYNLMTLINFLLGQGRPRAHVLCMIIFRFRFWCVVWSVGTYCWNAKNIYFTANNYLVWFTYTDFGVLQILIYIYVWKRSYLTFRFAGNGLEPTTNKYCVSNLNFACSFMEQNACCTVLNQRYTIARTGMCFIFVIRLKFSSTTSQLPKYSSSHYDCMGILCIFDDLFGHQAKFATSHMPDNDVSIKQNGIDVQLQVQSLVTWHLSISLLHSYKSCYL